MTREDAKKGDAKKGTPRTRDLTQGSSEVSRRLWHRGARELPSGCTEALQEAQGGCQKV